MEYGEYELVKKSNSGEEVLQTFKGITAEDKGIEAFIEYCSTHPEDDQWVADRYNGITDGMGYESVERLMEWLDRNGYIYEDFLRGAYSIYLRTQLEDDAEDYEF